MKQNVLKKDSAANLYGNVMIWTVGIQWMENDFAQGRWHYNMICYVILFT